MLRLRRAASPIALTSLVLVVTACATLRRGAPPLREVRPTVRSGMSQMAETILEVEAVLQSDASLTPGDADRVVSLLVQLEETARSLSLEGVPHPGIQGHLPELRAAAVDAVAGARQQPPSYEAFGRLEAVCHRCHATPLQ